MAEGRYGVKPIVTNCDLTFFLAKTEFIQY